ncbi:hypothetical protein [Cupriavidus pauculus]|uniref:hypothetical protein n=2 Tax=Cupriavidus TaxID=106589 RepID=UPI000781C076|nr:hypothetical protein [Cupriavidus pauculus]
MDWQDADSGQFPNRPLAKLFEVLDTQVSWRVEGTVKAGFWGILTSAGVDIRYDLSEAKIDAVDAYFKAKAEALKAAPESPEQKMDLAICNLVMPSIAELQLFFFERMQEADKKDSEKQRKKDKETQDKLRNEVHNSGSGGASGSGASGGGGIGRIGGPNTKNGG